MQARSTNDVPRRASLEALNPHRRFGGSRKGQHGGALSVQLQRACRLRTLKLADRGSLRALSLSEFPGPGARRAAAAQRPAAASPGDGRPGRGDGRPGRGDGRAPGAGGTVPVTSIAGGLGIPSPRPGATGKAGAWC